MSEREPSQRPREEPNATWDVEAISNALQAEPLLRRHPIHGWGFQLTLDEEPRYPPTRLDLYPERCLARYRSGSVKLDLANISAVATEANGLRISAADQHARLACLVKSDGSLALTILMGTEAAQERPPGRQPQAVPVSPPEAPPPAVAKAAAPAKTPEGVGAAVPEPPQAEAQPRLTLAGQVGATPEFHTTPKGTLVARFPLAVHHEDNTTSWHTVLAFGERAQKLKGSLQKGQQVEVVGYVHTREIRTQGGGTRPVQELYAVVVKTR